MINVTIICEAKLKEKYLRDACDEYIKRLSALCKLKIIELSPKKLSDNPSDNEIKNALEAEGKEIAAKIPKGAKIYAMCIEGKQFTSEEIAKQFSDSALNSESNIVFIIGSSFGLSEEIKKSASIKLSMSKMTFPHQLARVMLLEQIYRAFTINSGIKYHK
ncbi:MAG: 23S rRNA (pseudouridine(1915)-N(3))-methyltransferase RlmH [Ruminococcus sp.]|nr:23S rRNA (pseudouridine(1915)-N(3))-methyltransferase RlmH [Candidatus Copronaster equi]